MEIILQGDYGRAMATAVFGITRVVSCVSSVLLLPNDYDKTSVRWTRPDTRTMNYYYYRFNTIIMVTVITNNNNIIIYIISSSRVKFELI